MSTILENAGNGTTEGTKVKTNEENTLGATGIESGTIAETGSTGTGGISET